MTQDQIRKLLGGYATNALTADERRTLFEAALEDQELFNALQNEDALRELLDEPVLREQVRAALQTRRPGFSWRRWTLGVALPAVAAVIVIAVMNRANAPRPAAQIPQQIAQQIAQAPVPPAPAASAPIATGQLSSPAQVLSEGAKKQADALQKVSPKAAAAIPPQPAPQLESARVARPALSAPQIANFRAAAPPPVLPAGVRQQFSAGLATSATLYQGPLVRYSLLRSGPAGKSVRVEVTIGITGYMALYQLDDAGNSTRVFPNGNDVAAPVLLNQAIQIPANPIEVADGARLRLMVVPAPPQAVNGFLGGAAGAETTIGAGNPPLAPLVVDIPLVP